MHITCNCAKFKNCQKNTLQLTTLCDCCANKPNVRYFRSKYGNFESWLRKFRTKRMATLIKTRKRLFVLGVNNLGADFRNRTKSIRIRELSCANFRLRIAICIFEVPSKINSYTKSIRVIYDLATMQHVTVKFSENIGKYIRLFLYRI